MVGENGIPVTPDFHVPLRNFCARLIGDDRCDCPSCQIDEHEPIDCRGEN